MEKCEQCLILEKRLRQVERLLIGLGFSKSLEAHGDVLLCLSAARGIASGDDLSTWAHEEFIIPGRNCK